MAKKSDPSRIPSTTSMAYDKMLPRWNKMASVLGGTETMREAGAEFLPQHEKETDQAWRERLGRNTLFNMLQITLDSLVGRPFSDPVEVSDDVPDDMKLLLEDVDLQGNNIDVFGREWFRDGMSNGFAGVLVEFPRTNITPDRTLEDDIREGVRPYWVAIPSENVIFANANIIDGHEILTHIRFREEIVEQEGFAEVSRTRIRVLDLIDAGMPTRLPTGFVPFGLRGVETIVENDGMTTMAFDKSRVQVSIYREDLKADEDSEDRWVLDEVFFMEIGVIPFAVFYAERDGLMLAKPPLLDLADLNISWWQSASDQRMVLTVARFPILASSGEIDEDKITVGPSAWLNVKDPNGSWYYVEHSGAAIEAGREDMASLVEQMAEYGAQFLKRQPGDMTATARALDSAEATSPLQDMSIRFNDTLNVAWGFSAMWLGRDSSDIGSLGVATDFGPEEINSSDVAELGQARRGRDLSRPKYLAELQRRGTLGDDFDADENEKELEDERAEFADGVANLDIDPAGGDDPPDPGAPPAEKNSAAEE